MSDLASLEAETSLIRHAIIYPRETLSVSDLSPDDFSDYRHNLIWKSIQEIYDEYQPDKIDKVVLQKHSNVDEEFISSTLSYKTVGSNAEVWVQEIKRASLAARLRNTLLVLADDECDDPYESLENAIVSIESLRGNKNEKEGDIKEAVSAAIQKAEMAFDGSAAGVDVGFSCIKRIMGGIPFGVITIIGAKTSIGKTALGVSLSYNACLNGYRCDYYTLEDSKDRLVNRLMGIHADLPVQKIITGELQFEEYGKMISAAGDISKMNLGIYDKFPRNSESFILSARNNCRKNETKLMIVDYVQLLRSRKKHGSRNDEIDFIVTQFKKLAKDLNVAVVLLSQLRREYQDKDGKPSRDQLRDSGTLEQHAHVILMLHRKKGQQDGWTDLLVEKNKDGPTGEVKIYYEGKYTRYQEKPSRSMAEGNGISDLLE